YGVIVVDAVSAGLPTGVDHGSALEAVSVPMPLIDYVEAVGRRPAWHRGRALPGASRDGLVPKPSVVQRPGPKDLRAVSRARRLPRLGARSGTELGRYLGRHNSAGTCPARCGWNLTSYTLPPSRAGSTLRSQS